MNVIGVTFTVLGVLLYSNNVNSQQHGGAPQYAYSSASRPNTQETAVPPIYSKSVKAVLARSGPTVQQEYSPEYPAATGLAASQQYYQDQREPQRVAYAQQSPNEYASSASPDLQKFAYPAQQQYQQQYQQQAQYQQQPQYSSAADVSTFSYTSPVVSYSNQGLVRQPAGKQGSPSYSSAPSLSKPQYQSQSAVQYVSGGSSGQSLSQRTYSSPNPAYTYSQSPSTQNDYSAQTIQSASPVAYSGQQASYEVPNKYQSYQPQRNLIRLNQEIPQTYKTSAQPSYVQPEPQQYSTAQQASSTYETAAQVPQQYYVPQQSSVYSGSPESKIKAGITYV